MLPQYNKASDDIRFEQRFYFNQITLLLRNKIEMQFLELHQ